MAGSEQNRLVMSREVVPEVLKGNGIIIVVEMPDNNVFALWYELCPNIYLSDALA